MTYDYEDQEDFDAAEMETDHDIDVQQFVGSALPDAEIAERMGLQFVEDDETPLLDRIGLKRCTECDTIVMKADVEELDDDCRICTECFDDA